MTDLAAYVEAPPAGIGEIAGALAKAQAEMSNPKFDKENPYFKSRYSSLASVRDAVVPALAKHGIAITQDAVTNIETGTVSCMTFLYHTSGQTLQFGPYVLPVSKSDAQGFSSAGTYAKRVQLMSVCVVAGDDDDDAEGAVEHTVHGHKPVKGPSQDEVNALADSFRLADKVGIDGPIYDVHIKAKPDAELYRTAWALLPSDMRTRLKKAIARVQEANGEPTHANGQ